jgi:A/G-specific adenine glycosylase
MIAKNKVFVTTLIEWSTTIIRDMPWKGIRNPYYIWLSEIILQQTRVEQGRKYYEKFVELFPTITHLANEKIDTILKNWEGLGYYSRARNLHETAMYIAKEHQGVFPKTYLEILNLKGVGKYTAAAIASFAYDLPYAVVDGNVIRVLARYFGIKEAFDTSSGKKTFEESAQKLLPNDAASKYNQAIMDFGALVCKPALPMCDTCPLGNSCYAYKKDEVNILPYRAKKTKVEERFFNYFVFTYKNKFYVQKRNAEFWRDLYQFYLIESEKLFSEKEVAKELKKINIHDASLIHTKDLTQKLSHRKIYARFFYLELANKPLFDDFEEISKSKLTNFAFPRIINLYIQNNF